MRQTKTVRARAALEITASMEHYLSAIHKLSESPGVARIRDISRELGVRTASATNAVVNLSKSGLARHESYGYVELTAAGKKLAREVLRRREVLLRFLTEILELDPKLAERDACGMEHCLSRQTLERLVQFLEFMRLGPKGEEKGMRCLQQLRSFYETGLAPNCSDCTKV